MQFKIEIIFLLIHHYKDYALSERIIFTFFSGWNVLFVQKHQINIMLEWIIGKEAP